MVLKNKNKRLLAFTKQKSSTFGAKKTHCTVLRNVTRCMVSQEKRVQPFTRNKNITRFVKDNRCHIFFRVLTVLGFALFIPRGCRIHPHPALMIPRVGLNWSPGMNRSLYLKCTANYLHFIF